MRHISFKSFFYKLLRRVPMPVISIVVGVAAGLAVWLALDQIQTRAIKKIADRELKVQLDLQTRESLILFSDYVAQYVASAHLSTEDRRLAEYLERPQQPHRETQLAAFRDFAAQWRPGIVAQTSTSVTTHMLLADTRGQVLEISPPADKPLPEDWLADVRDRLGYEGTAQAQLALFNDQPYLIVRDAIESSDGRRLGDLILVVTLDEAFLAASQRGLSSVGATIALVDQGEQRILASIDHGLLPLGTPISKLQQDYLITTQSLPEYEGADWNVLFATFLPHDSVNKMSSRMRNFERQQRVRAALAYILVFTLVIYLISARLNKVLKRMSRFSQRALGIEEPGFSHGANQLVLLEEWIGHFTQLVLKAREEMSQRHASEIRRSEALKAAVMEASLDSIVTLNRKGEIVELNPTAERTLGTPRDLAIGTIFSKHYLSAESRKTFVSLLKSSRRARHEGLLPHTRGQLEARRADGSRLPLELSIAPIQMEGRFLYTLYMHDITKRKEAEREIQSLARIAGESPNPILRVTTSGMLVYANNASLPLLSAWEVCEGSHLPPEWIAVVREAFRGSDHHEREAQIGEQVYSLLFAPIRELGYVNIYARDITAVRHAEQAARQHQSELAHVCRLSTMGEVATGMAHELNQPLAAIVNYANGCSRRLQGNLGHREELVEAMGQIATQAQRASEIIRRLRALVGKQPPIRSHTDLNHLVREVCTFVELETEKLDVTIELQLDSCDIPLNVDTVQIEQVLLNLVRNALDALEDAPPQARRLTVHTSVVGNEAQVTVEDSGPGIPPERLESLFEPFFTTKESGMGMGLPISQTIVENHGGRIWAEDSNQQGALFIVRLPLAEAAEPQLDAVGLR